MNAFDHQREGTRMYNNLNQDQKRVIDDLLCSINGKSHYIVKKSFCAYARTIIDL